MSQSAYFNEDVDNQLLLLVKSYPFMYQSAHKDSKNKTLREKTWREIAAIMGKDVGDCKSRYKTIRDSYRKMKRRLVTHGFKTPSGGLPRSKYINAELSFLDMNFRGKIKHDEETQSSQDETSQPECATTFHIESNDEEDIELQDEAFRELTNIREKLKLGYDKMLENIENNEEFQNDDSQSETNANFDETENDNRECFKKWSSQFVTETSPQSTERPIKRQCVEHPIQTFFRSMAATVMTFPPHLIAEARIKVCNIISEIELEALKQQINEDPVPPPPKKDSSSRPLVLFYGSAVSNKSSSPET